MLIFGLTFLNIALFSVFLLLLCFQNYDRIWLHCKKSIDFPFSYHIYCHICRVFLPREVFFVKILAYTYSTGTPRTYYSILFHSWQYFIYVVVFIFRYIGFFSPIDFCHISIFMWVFFHFRSMFENQSA